MRVAGRGTHIRLHVKVSAPRALLTGGRGLGPVSRREGGEPIFIPTEVWRDTIFSFLIFEDGY